MIADESRPAGKPAPTVLATLQARWKWVCAGVVLAVVAGLAAECHYGDRREFAGAVLHTPLPSGEAGKHLIPLADLKSIGALVKSPESLRAVVEERGLDLSPQALADRLDVKSAPGSPTLAVTLQWRGPGDGAAVLDAAMEQFVARAGELRRRRLDERAADFAAARADSERELQAGRDRLAAFYEQNGVTDLPHELRKATAEAETSEAALTLARRAEAIGRAQLADLDATIDRFAAKGPDAGAAAAQNPVRLQQMITDERTREQSRAKLEAKRRELAAVRGVAAKGAASQVELSRIEAEVAGLEVLAQDSERVTGLKKELAGSDRSADVPPLLQQAFAKRLDLNLQVLGTRAELPVLEADGGAKRQRVERLLKLQSQSAPLLWQVERAEAERNRLQAHGDQVRVLLAMTGGEARVHQPAAAVPRTFGGARAWALPAAVGGCTLLLCLGAVVAARPRDDGAAAVGLDLLASVPPGGALTDAEVRSLALGLRQRLPRAGTAILFTPVGGGPRTRDLLARTAGCLAERDERVLIIDAGFAEGRTPEAGLSNYLAFQCVRPGEVVRPTAVFGVDHLPAGNAAASQDALATHRMRELLEQLRRTYSIILVAGPPVAAATDVQILAAYQDGTVLLLDTPDAPPALTRDLFRTYRRVGVPFLGCVHLAG